MTTLAERRKLEAEARQREARAVKLEAEELSDADLEARINDVLERAEFRHAAVWFPVFVAERTRRHWR